MKVLQYVLASGVSTLEMRSVLEEGLGIPQGPPRPAPGVTLSDAEKAERAKVSAGLKQAQREWRLGLSMQKYADIRKKYNDAGVDIHIAQICAILLVG